MSNPSLFLIILLLSTVYAYGQEVGKLYKGKKIRVAPVIEQRDTSGLNPFIRAAKVELLYYKSNRMQWKGNDSNILEKGNLNIPTDRIAKRIVLDSSQVVDWEYSLYKMHLCEEFMVAGCYEPRHLLVFYDKGERLLGAIEICISCAGGWVSPGMRKVVFCPERTGILASMIK